MEKSRSMISSSGGIIASYYPEKVGVLRGGKAGLATAITACKPHFKSVFPGVRTSVSSAT